MLLSHFGEAFPVDEFQETWVRHFWVIAETRLALKPGASRIACVVSFFTLSKRKGLPHLSGSRRLRSSRFRTTTSYCGRGSRTIVVIPNNNKLLRTRIAYDRRDSEQQQVTADEDRGRLVRRP